ncbi:MAG: 2OG-Fe(II) oxygenase [Vicinamibacterales bacterium]
MPAPSLVVPDSSEAIAARVAATDWTTVESDLSGRGFARLPPLVGRDTCRALIEMYGEPGHFRSRIEMARHNFGVGDYQYFAYPLPRAVQTLRASVYPHLASIANRWHALLAKDDASTPPFPASLATFLEECHAAGQTRPTPLLLHYEAGGFNCLHQDVYGDIVFPLQLLVFLAEPGHDYEGGELVLVEQRPRAQSIPHVVRGSAGSAVVFTTRHRPAKGSRGHHRVTVRHGVSRVSAGRRHTLGVIFHDAR